MTNLLIGTFVRECQIFAGHVISVRAAATHRALVHEFVSRLPVPDQPVENLILDGLLFKVALQWSSHVHKQYHADDTTSCGFNPDTDLVRSWRSRHSSPVSVFADWATSFLDKVEQAHRPAPTSRVKEIIDRGIETRLSVRSLARETACHPVRLRAIFKRDVGMSIREYQTRRRILKAAQLLAGTDVKVDAIARAAGFPNRKNFYDAFKRTLHTSHRRSGAGRRPTWNLSRTVYSHKPAVTDGSYQNRHHSHIAHDRLCRVVVSAARPIGS